MIGAGHFVGSVIERESNIPPCRSSSANLALVAVATRARFAELELRVIIDSTNPENIESFLESC